jgi:hypothetical protein
MTKDLIAIEDYIEKIVGHPSQLTNFVLEVNDRVLLTSIARQTVRGIGLTDRQYTLVKEKLTKYRDQFNTTSDVEFEVSLKTLRTPLRSIDRSKTVSLRKDGNKLDIVIKFPFNKKTIVIINEISKKYSDSYKHVKGSNEHSFKFYEPIVVDIIEMLQDRNFYIEQEILDSYKEIKSIIENPLNYKPVIKDKNPYNVDERVLSIAKTEIGNLTNDTLVKYYDRSLRYGIEKFEKLDFQNVSILTNKIANRNCQKVYISPKNYNIDNVVDTLNELNRYPLIVVLDTNSELDQLIMTFNSLKRYIPASEQILLDRIENKTDKNYAVNSFIKDQGFSTWLDKNVKVVYIFQQRLPKLLLKTEWAPIAVLQNSGMRLHTTVATYLESRCDLVVAIDDQPSSFEKNTSRKTLYEIL